MSVTVDESLLAIRTKHILSSLDRMDTILSLCLERNQIDKFVELNNQIARNILQWSTDPNDPKHIWRDASGKQVRVTIDDRDFLICEHPWVEGVNTESEISFSYGYNYHKNIIDWRAWTRSKLLEGLKHE